MANSKIVDNSVRVLVIEDNDDDSELLLRQLKKSGMASHVKFITNGQKALDFLTAPGATSPTDELIAIFLDLKLPMLSGLELLRKVRADEKLQNIPVIVMTSSNDPKDMEECRRLKVTNYVTKPVNFTTFSKAVADVFHLPRQDDPLEPSREI